jgi:hypothetical protein
MSQEKKYLLYKNVFIQHISGFVGRYDQKQNGRLLTKLFQALHDDI